MNSFSWRIKQNLQRHRFLRLVTLATGSEETSVEFPNQGFLEKNRIVWMVPDGTGSVRRIRGGLFFPGITLPGRLD
jgi:hypothetical protein